MLKRNDKRKLDKYLMKVNDSEKILNNVIANFSINIEILDYLASNSRNGRYSLRCSTLSELIEDSLHNYNDFLIGLCGDTKKDD